MSELYFAKNYVIEVIQDEDAESPRTSFDNLGKMVCSHGRYFLGDEQLNVDDYNSWEEAKKDLVEDGLCLDLYLYDHSGITISTSPFASRWDSGQVGFIYVSKEDIRNIYGVKKVTKKIREKVLEALQAEVETYDQYLMGDIYGFKMWKIKDSYLEYMKKENIDIEDLDINVLQYHGEELNSCWGFYGDDIFENGMIDYLGLEKNIIEELKEKYNRKSIAV